MPFQLVIIRGRGVSQYIKLPQGVTTLGRHQDCQVRVASSQVSRKHCQVFEKQGLLLVKDLGSSNGTFVNGKKVVDQQVLSPGDELSVGSVRFRVEKADAAGAPAGPDAGKPADTVVTDPVVAGSGEVAISDDQTTRVAGPLKGKPVPAAAKGAKVEDADAPIEVSEDDVADYLLDIELDDEDKV